jgi:hypothetical protein
MKRLLLMGAPALTLGLAFLAWTFYSRHNADLEFERSQQQKQLEAGRRFRKAYGSDDVRIIGVLANPKEIHRGQQSLLCYGVANAKTVKLDPPVEPVHPAPSYCFEISPRQTTTYTITAEDGNGKSVQQSATITVR